MKRKEHIDRLQAICQQHLAKAKGYKQLPKAILNYKQDAKTWSILECIEHINLYGDFYLVEMETQLLKANKAPAAEYFKPGWLGNYFAKSMLPEGKLNKINTFKSMNPIFSELNETVIERFIKQTEKLIELLDLARQYNLTKVRTGITITNLIRLRIGDTFNFHISHNERHIRQADRQQKIAEKESETTV
ncbi:MAG: DinB family protein [Bacteroidota bacterium]